MIDLWRGWPSQQLLCVPSTEILDSIRDFSVQSCRKALLVLDARRVALDQFAAQFRGLQISTVIPPSDPSGVRTAEATYRMYTEACLHRMVVLGVPPDDARKEAASGQENEGREG